MPSFLFGNALTETTFTDGEFGTIYRSFKFNADDECMAGDDAGNNLIEETDARGHKTTYTYNELGKVESVTDSLSHRTEFTYNSRGQNTAVRDATNNVSSATYDMLGNVTRLAGPLGGATNYTYDDMGRLTSESTVSGGTKSYEYNELNVRKKITNARGQIRQIFYDSMGRITGYTSPEGAVSYTYDANSNVLTVNDSHGTITRTYDALNRVSSYTDTYGKVIRYEYDAVGNLSKIIYPDNTAVTYAYDANHNLIRVTDWANRVTSYTYDVNNRVVGVTKPDGSVTTTVYDNKQRVTSTVERTDGGVVITGFEYTYDDLSRIIEEKVLANSTKMCYTYDNLSRVTARTVKKLSDNSVVSTETFNYDAAGNVTSAPDSSFQYDTNNRLISFNGNTVSYDLDGNMLSNGSLTCTYDSANRLVSAGGHTYTYNAEDVRIRNLCADEDTTYTYNTNAKLSMLLMKTTNGVVTKYVYGKGLIGEETANIFKAYHFDCRGSTIAITDASGNITDTFAYDTYGKLLTRTGTSAVIFGYNGRDGVVTDDNGLIYMRARYYSPDMKRFINADIIPGKLSNAVTLNRFAYANGNPVSFIDPFGLSVWSWIKDKYNDAKDWVVDTYNDAKDAVVETYNNAKDFVVDTYNDAKQVVVDTYNEVKDWTIDTYNNVKERVVNTYNDAKDFVVDKYNDVKDWVDEKIVQPVTTVVNNVKEDIQNYDKNNTDEQKVLNSHYFSSYKGKLVIRTDMDRSGSFGVLFITHETNNRTNPEDVIRHEYGHTKQLDQLGIVNYALFIGLPSWQEWSSDSYYDRPWEVTADTYGGVQSRTPSQAKIDAGEDYLDIIKSDIPIWEKIAQLSQYYN